MIGVFLLKYSMEHTYKLSLLRGVMFPSFYFLIIEESNKVFFKSDNKKKETLAIFLIKTKANISQA